MIFRKKGEPETEQEMVERSLDMLTRAEAAADADQATADAKTAKKAAREEAKAAKTAAKREAKLAKLESKKAEAAAAAAAQPRITPKKAKNAIAVGKILAPVLIPVVAPLAAKAFGSVREALDRRQARKLGVDVESLGEYTGHGAALHARISGVYDSVRGLRESGNAADVALADETTRHLHDLTLAVRLAERMPAPRRKEAHRGIADEVTQLESQLMKRLGV